MPRLQPEPGYISAKEAAAILNISQAVLSHYVSEGRVKRYGPPERKHKFYKLSEIEALKEARNIFAKDEQASDERPYQRGQWSENLTCTFALSQESDMENIVRISIDLFGDGQTPAEIRSTWLHKNPETFYTLRNHADVIVGYASLLPLTKSLMDRLLQEEIKVSSLRSEDIQEFVPGGKYQIYLAAVCVDPTCSRHQKHEYGARLVHGLISVLFDWAQRGIEIETITARSRTADGKRLCRKLGLTQIHSPSRHPEMSLYEVRVADSGLPILERYSSLLAQWKAQQTSTKESTS